MLESARVEVIRQADAALAAMTLLAELAPGHRISLTRLRTRVRRIAEAEAGRGEA